ncbi:MAG: SDR family oxidoreductase [Candidatus Microthrix sp.]|nr:SDR family oxidoreductase [Candidatus Microthrix sp.]
MGRSGMTVAGAHAVITGGSSGIGEATALELARRGARVTLLARDPDRLRAAADRIEAALGGAASVGPVSVGTVSVDVADREAVVDGFGGIVAERGEVDVLVTSAGITRPGRFTELSDEVFTSMIDVDYYGTLWPIRAVVPSMIRRGSGSIVAVSSAAAIVGIYGYSAYGAAKFAVRGLTESLRTELAPHGVNVACAYPADVDTPMLAEEEQFKPAETAAIAGSIQPVPPERVAAAIVAGIERGRPEIYADAQSRALARTVATVPGVFRAVFDRRVRSVGPHVG